MSDQTRLIEKYLNTYAEPDVREMSIERLSEFQSLLVIPVYDEPLAQLKPIIDYACDRSVALVLVFNAPEPASTGQPASSQSDEEYRAALMRTREVLKSLHSLYKLQEKDGYYSAQTSALNCLYLLDRCQPDKLIPRKQGVGLARKLGMDFGLKLIHLQSHESAEQVAWMHSCDADVRLPDGYFDIAVPDNNCAAAVYPFEHCPDEGYEQAMFLYDYSLRYYVDQLANAGSPYAFHTIGSLILVRPGAYAAVRGIPKRSAAEDFYLLNKLAKVGSVHSLEQPVLQIAGRPSQRVPFGTGPAISKIQNLENPTEEYSFYNPRCFQALGTLLKIISEAGQSFATHELLFEAISDRMSEKDSAAVIDALLSMKIEKQFSHLAQKKDHASFEKAFHTWFDAFVTLRFIHLLRDAIYPNICFAELSSALDKS